MRAAVDVGFGYTKAVSEDGRSVSFPSAVLRESAGESALTQTFGPRESDHRVEIRTDPDAPPTRYRIGQDALAMGGTRTWETSAAERADYGLLTLAALRLVGCVGPARVAVGVPLSLYQSKTSRESLRLRLQGTDAWVQADQAPPARITLEEVTVLPQAAGAFLAEVSQSPEIGRRLCGVVDVGFRTTDFLLLRPTKSGPVPEMALSGSLNQGVGELYDQVARTLGEQRAALLNSARIEHYAALGLPYILDGEEVPLERLLTAEGRNLAETIRTRVQRAWGEVWRDMGLVLVTGGGGARLWPHLEGMHPLARLTGDPAMANARGFLTALSSGVLR